MPALPPKAKREMRFSATGALDIESEPGQGTAVTVSFRAERVVQQVLRAGPAGGRQPTW